MATENQNETRTGIDNLNDSLSSIEQKVQNNQKLIMWSCVGIAAVVCLILIYVYAVRKPGIEAADNAVGQADMTLATGNDSLALVQYQQVASEYGYDGGNRAALNAAILLYQDGKYQEAIEWLKKYSPKEKLIGASAKSLEGDCYVNLKEYDKALSCFREAAKISGNNPAYTPTFLLKEATVQRELKNYSAEADLYKTIIDKYPAYGSVVNIDFEKYLKRAQAQAAAK